MEHIAKSIQSIGKNEKRKSRKSLTQLKEINALDLIGKTADKKDFAKVEKMIRTAFPKVQTDKMNILIAMIKDEEWTDRRLFDTAMSLIKNHKYPDWVIADWFDNGVKLYPYSKYLEKLNQSREINNEITWYRIDGVMRWGFTHETKDIPGLKELEVKV